MSQAQEPLIPAGDTPEGNRFSTAMRGFARSLIRSGVFLLRPSLATILTPRDGSPPLTLRWGELNRVLLSSNASIQLPRIAPEWVGAPLRVIKLSASGALTLAPVGLALDYRTVPTVNGASSVTLTDAGLYEFITDGRLWFASKAVP